MREEENSHRIIRGWDMNPIFPREVLIQRIHLMKEDVKFTRLGDKKGLYYVDDSYDGLQNYLCSEYRIEVATKHIIKPRIAIHANGDQIKYGEELFWENLKRDHENNKLDCYKAI
jgi:hypothetical protein